MNIFKTIIFLFVIQLFSVCCKSAYNTEEKAILNVLLPINDTSNQDGRKYYLVDEIDHIFVDSAISNQGELNFKTTLPRDKPVLRANIVLKDSNNPEVTIQKLGFKNPYKENNIYSSFYIERGQTTIDCFSLRGSDTVSSFLGSDQNVPFFRQLYLRYPDATDNRNAIISENLRLLEQYPFSLFFLEQLNSYKHRFEKKELISMLSVFSKELHRYKLYQSLNSFIEMPTGFETAIPYDVKLKNDDGREAFLNTKKEAYKLLVFWASWCGPCRAEIPQLKKVYQQHKKRGLEIVSISIDWSEKSWLKAVHEENMQWQQLWANGESKSQMDRRFDISAIPKAYLFDKNDSLIAKFTGSNSDIEAKLDSLFRN